MNKTLKQALDQAFLLGRRVLVSPVASVKTPRPRARAAASFEQKIGRINYDREMDFAARGERILWNATSSQNPKYAPLEGDIGVFVHYERNNPEGGRCEYHRIEDVSPPGSGRPEWDARQHQRAVIHLGDRIGETSIKEMCDSVISFNFKPFAEFGIERTWFQGNRYYRWNDNYQPDLTIIGGDAPTTDAPTEESAAIKFDEPLRADLIKIAREVADTINEAAEGKILIHDETIEATVRSFQMIMDNASGNRGVHIDRLQHGKTEMMLLLAKSFRRMLSRYENIEGRDNKVGIVLLCNRSQTTLYEQTISRFDNPEALFESQYPSNINLDAGKTRWLVDVHDRSTVLQPIMLSNRAVPRIEEVILNFRQQKVTHYLFLLDEAHEAMKSGQQFSRVLDGLGFNVNELVPGKSTFTPPIYVLGVTGTALTRFLLPRVVGRTRLYYTYPPTQPGSTYYGIKDMFAAGRIREIDEAWTFQDYMNLVDSCAELTKNPGYILVRSSAKSDDPIKGWFEEIARIKGWVTQNFNSTDGNIARLNDKLRTPCDAPCIVFIKNAARAGDTFSTTKHIRMFFDMRYAKEEPAAQSIGRFCGRAKDRREATFPIYTTVKNELTQWVEAMERCERGEPIPQIRETVYGSPLEPFIVMKNPLTHESTNGFVLEEFLQVITKAEHERQYDEHRRANPDFDKYWTSMEEEYRMTTHVHKNYGWNQAGALLGKNSIKNITRWKSASGELDPSNDEYEKIKPDFDALIAKYPQLADPDFGLSVKPEYLALETPNPFTDGGILNETKFDS
jgi:hypothetical protein